MAHHRFFRILYTEDHEPQVSKSAFGTNMGSGYSFFHKLTEHEMGPKSGFAADPISRRIRGAPERIDWFHPKILTVLRFLHAHFGSESVVAKRRREGPPEASAFEHFGPPPGVVSVASRGVLLRAQTCTFSHFGRLGPKWARARKK